MSAELRLQLTNSPDAVAAVESAIDGVVAGLELDALDADAIRTAVTEACKNVVLHAYEGTEGPMEVGLRVSPTAVEATVADEGIGIRPHLGERHYPHNGLGLPIIHQHAWRVTYTNRQGGGTEVRMEFAVQATASPPAGELAGTLLGRVVGAGTLRAEVAVPLEDGADVERLLQEAGELLGPDGGRLAAQRRAARDGGPERLVLSLSPSG